MLAVLYWLDALYLVIRMHLPMVQAGDYLLLCRVTGLFLPRLLTRQRLVARSVVFLVFVVSVLVPDPSSLLLRILSETVLLCLLWDTPKGWIRRYQVLYQRVMAGFARGVMLPLTPATAVGTDL